MNKYQEALNNLVGYRTGFRGGKTIIQDYINTLQELVDTTKIPTLEEVKKEWKELDYVYIESSISPLIFFTNQKEDKYILINKDEKVYRTMEVSSNHACLLTFQEHQLLTKTFRALGWFDE